MAVSWDAVKAGDVLWDRHRTKMGNTKMRRMGEWTVKIVSIDHAAGRAVVRWNGNPERVYFRRQVERLFRNQMKPRPSHA